MRAFHERCAEEDLALAVAQTDVKGDRSLGPAEQGARGQPGRLPAHRRGAPGRVVRGCKAHTSVSTNANEIIVLPTRALGEADADYAVAFAVPADAPGLTMIASPHGGSVAEKNAFEHPISARHKMMETLTVFEDVFVPQERVFLAGEWQFAGPWPSPSWSSTASPPCPTSCPWWTPWWDGPPAGGVQRGGQGGPRAGQAGLADRLRRGAGALAETAARRCRVHPPGGAPDP